MRNLPLVMNEGTGNIKCCPVIEKLTIWYPQLLDSALCLHPKDCRNDRVVVYLYYAL